MVAAVSWLYRWTFTENFSGHSESNGELIKRSPERNYCAATRNDRFNRNDNHKQRQLKKPFAWCNYPWDNRQSFSQLILSRLKLWAHRDWNQDTELCITGSNWGNQRNTRFLTFRIYCTCLYRSILSFSSAECHYSYRWDRAIANKLWSRFSVRITGSVCVHTFRHQRPYVGQRALFARQLSRASNPVPSRWMRNVRRRTCGTFCAVGKERGGSGEGWDGRDLSFALSFSVPLRPKAPPQTKLPKLGPGQGTSQKTRVTCRRPKEREGRISVASRSGFVTGWLA